MPIDPVEKIDTSLVVVRQPDTPLDESVAREIAALMRDPVVEQNVGGPISLIRITSMRQQVEIAVDPARVTFVDQGDREPCRQEFPGIITEALQLLGSRGLQTRAYGWNYKIAFDNPHREPAGETIVRLFVNTSFITEAAGIEPQSATVKLVYSHGEAQYTLNLEPRLDPAAERYFAHLNIHFQVPFDVGSTSVASDLERQYSDFKEQLARLIGD